jgi:hypothetical protein
MKIGSLYYAGFPRQANNTALLRAIRELVAGSDIYLAPADPSQISEACKDLTYYPAPAKVPSLEIWIDAAVLRPKISPREIEQVLGAQISQLAADSLACQPQYFGNSTGSRVKVVVVPTGYEQVMPNLPT